MANEKTEKKESPFEAIIRGYLETMAAQDEAFARTFAKPNKSVAECCKYIKSEAQKLKDWNVAIVEDATVYGWAVHYYDEDDIVVDAAPKARVATSAPTPTTHVKPVEPEKPKERQLSIFDFL